MKLGDINIYSLRKLVAIGSPLVQAIPWINADSCGPFY